MDIKNIVSSVSSLVPFWATKIISYCGLGNEYSMLFNVVIQQMISPLEEYITEQIIYFCFVIFMCIIVLWKSNIFDPNMFKIFVKKSITLIGSEKDNSINYSSTLEALNIALIEKYDYHNIIFNKESKTDVMLDEIVNYKLEKDLYLTIERNDKDQVVYILSSYTKDLNKFITNIVKTYCPLNRQKYVHLYGEESDFTYSYSRMMTSLTYTLVHKYKLTNLLNKENKNVIDEEESNKKNEKNTSRETKIVNEKKAKMLFLIDEYKNYELEDDMFITISRMGPIVKYTLRSETRNIIDFIDKCDNYYITNINNTKYKHRLVMQGNETYGDRSRALNIYPQTIIALNYYLIHTIGYKNYRIIPNTKVSTTRYHDEMEEDEDDNIHKCMLENINSLEFDNMILTIKRYSSSDYSSINVTIDYILESDTVDLEKYVNNCVDNYSKIIKEKNKDKLFHFTLTSFTRGNACFNEELIYDSKPLLHESFDNIYCEHSELIKKDLHKLKNIDYYVKTGLKRKKSYLFYGEPGCGKTSMIVAMALYDKRHIIELPLSLIKNSGDLEEIMNLKEINDITFDKDEIILLFDEIDVGFEDLLGKRDNEEIKKKPVEENKEMNDELCNEMTNVNVENGKVNLRKLFTKFDNKDVISTVSLNVGALLSKFDGICNYNGSTLIATTNHKDKLDPALCREMRLTPLYFTYSRQQDAINIIEKFFDNKITDENKYLIRDRHMTPAKLTFLCEKHEDMELNEFLQMLNKM